MGPTNPPTPPHSSCLYTYICTYIYTYAGGVLGSAIIYIFPALLFLATSKARADAGADATRASNLERLGCKGMAALGVVLGVLGGATSVANAFF